VKSTSWAQSCPYRCGLVVKPTKLVPKTKAATTATTAAVVAARALRTGTAVRPRPGSNAICTPMPPVVDPVTLSDLLKDQARAVAGGSATPSGLPALAAARQATGITRASGSSAMATMPPPKMARLTSTPGVGSARLAGPSGISGEAAMATATAMNAPPVVAMPARARLKVASVPRVIPSARRTG